MYKKHKRKRQTKQIWKQIGFGLQKIYRHNGPSALQNLLEGKPLRKKKRYYNNKDSIATQRYLTRQAKWVARANGTKYIPRSQWEKKRKEHIRKFGTQHQTGYDPWN